MAITKLLNNITGVPDAKTSPHGRGIFLMRYYAKFNSGSQTKNKAQEAAYEFGKPFGGTLIGSDAALDKFVENLKNGIDKINICFHRCSDIQYSKHFYQNMNDFSFSVGEIFSFSFYPVKQDYIIDEPLDDASDVITETVFKF